jgi:hypothetical protein
LVFRAAGSGVVLVLVLVVLAELELEEVAGADAWAVAPADGASVTPGAVEPPHPATTAATAATEQVRMIGLRMEVPESSERV